MRLQNCLISSKIWVAEKLSKFHTVWSKSDKLATLILKREDKYKSWKGEVKEEAFEANVNREEEIERKGKVHSWNHLGSKEEKTKKKAVVFCYYFVFPPQVTIEESAIVTNDMSLGNVLTFLRLFMSWCSKVQQKLLYWTLKCLLTFANKCKNNLLLRFDFLKSENSSFF